MADMQCEDKGCPCYGLNGTCSPREKGCVLQPAPAGETDLHAAILALAPEDSDSSDFATGYALARDEAAALVSASTMPSGASVPAKDMNELLDLPMHDTVHNAVHRVYFRAGLLACREYMARFVTAESSTMAASIRANWWPTLGDDPGAPRKLHWDEIATGGEEGPWDTKDISISVEALPIALSFLESQSIAAAPAPQGEARQGNLMRQAVATVVSRVGDELRIGWLRPERCDVGTLLYCATAPSQPIAPQGEDKPGATA